jgi:alpha-D-xyloside xylohydrolase
MRNPFFLKFCCLLTIVATNCSTRSSYEKIDDGVIIHIGQKDGTKNLKLQVISDKIIHVIASPVDTFSTFNSLVVVPDLKKSGDWDIIDGDSTLTLQTSQLKARVSLRTGEVAFLDSAGSEILQEQRGGGKYFTAVTIDGESSYNIRQVFESSDDEAFYGLGGHQNGQMNYKGQDVELVQHNIVDVVPFVYSSRGIM